MWAGVAKSQRATSIGLVPKGLRVVAGIDVVAFAQASTLQSMPAVHLGSGCDP